MMARPDEIGHTAPVEVRELRAADRAAAIDLWERAQLTRPWNPPADDFDRALAGQTSAVLGAVEDDVLVATVMIGHDGHRGWAYYLAVDPDRQREGLGRRMMTAAEDWLRGQGAVKMQVMVRHSNDATIAFYERLGYADGDVVVLARWLDQPSAG